MRINIDPVTRLEGHLSLSLDIDGGQVTSAHCSGTMFRGFELLLQGRDPYDACPISQRICGVCPVSHGIASALCLEQALGIQLSDNARLLRNLILGANFIQSHLTHFYHLCALDFVDITALAGYAGQDPLWTGLRDWYASELASSSLHPAAPFLPRYVADYITDPATNLGVIQHYFQALSMRSLAHEMVAVFGGKAPHPAAIVPGGVTCVPTLDRIEAYGSRLQQLQDFIDTTYLPDVVAIAKAFPQYGKVGQGPRRLLSYGAFPEDSAGASLLAAGVYAAGQVTPLDPKNITEDTASAWFSTPSGLNPSSGQTVPAPTKDGAYSWVKAPRYGGAVVEVGPLARVLVTQAAGTNPDLSALLSGVLAQLNATPGVLFSALGRHIARAVECKLVAMRCAAWLDQLQPDLAGGQGYPVPQSGSGMGLMEAPRGALGHWVTIANRVIEAYQCVVPTTWNCSPRDDRGQPGAVEQALVGVPVADKDNPIEAMRVLRSFDPCLACAVH
jgi:ferredoxin hydrogenase large subunit/hydrogenase large subunit